MWPQQVVASEPLVKNGCIARSRVTRKLWIVRPRTPSRMSPILAAPLSPKWKTRIGESHVLQSVVVVSGFFMLLVGLLYMKTLDNSRNVNAECVVVVGWAI